MSISETHPKCAELSIQSTFSIYHLHREADWVSTCTGLQVPGLGLFVVLRFEVLLVTTSLGSHASCGGTIGIPCQQVPFCLLFLHFERCVYSKMQNARRGGKAPAGTGHQCYRRTIHGCET